MVGVAALLVDYRSLGGPPRSRRASPLSEKTQTCRMEEGYLPLLPRSCLDEDFPAGRDMRDRHSRCHGRDMRKKRIAAKAVGPAQRFADFTRHIDRRDAGQLLA